MECGSGVGCFLSLTTSLIVIVCDRKAALWGSVYLDVHGEEDRNLKLVYAFENLAFWISILKIISYID